MNEEEVAKFQKKAPRTIKLKTAVVISTVLIFLTSLVTASGMSLAFILGRGNNGDRSLEDQRQTVVQEGEVVEDIAQNVGPSVVSIVTKRRVVQTDIFGSSTQESAGAGTGLIINSNGLILTNKHVVPEGTSSLEVITHNGETYKDVQIIGRDPLNDLAILKVTKPNNFRPAKLGNSDEVKTGQKVIAIGNALGQFQNSVTSGIISGMGRPITASSRDGSESAQLTNLFQTDAAINSGNSGGPLLDFNGEVIGINTAIAEDAQNIGFSIPINEAKGIIASVEKTGKLSRAYIGVRYVTISPSIANQLDLGVQEGAYISDEASSVVKNGPADKAGIRPGDIITKVNDKKLTQKLSLTSVISQYKVGDKISLVILRGDREIKLNLTLEEAPSN